MCLMKIHSNLTSLSLMEKLLLIHAMLIHSSCCGTMKQPQTAYSNAILLFVSLDYTVNEGNSATRILQLTMLIQLWLLWLRWGKAHNHVSKIRCNCPLKEQLWELPHSVLIRHYLRNLLWNANFKNPHRIVNSENRKSKDKVQSIFWMGMNYGIQALPLAFVFRNTARSLLWLSLVSLS